MVVRRYQPCKLNHENLPAPPQSLPLWISTVTPPPPPSYGRPWDVAQRCHWPANIWFMCWGIFSHLISPLLCALSPPPPQPPWPRAACASCTQLSVAHRKIWLDAYTYTIHYYTWTLYCTHRWASLIAERALNARLLTTEWPGSTPCRGIFT